MISIEPHPDNIRKKDKNNNNNNNQNTARVNNSNNNKSDNCNSKQNKGAQNTTITNKCDSAAVTVSNRKKKNKKKSNQDSAQQQQPQQQKEVEEQPTVVKANMDNEVIEPDVIDIKRRSPSVEQRTQQVRQNDEKNQTAQPQVSDDYLDDHLESFLLIDENELMRIDSADDFAELLGCEPDDLVKVVSIFGSIGHGKSYTLNHTFYNSQEVFQTSSSQDSCTIGIWAAYDEKRRVITLDTEGLLGVSANCQRRTRLLLKVLAISDIVIYRTRSERLEDNLFTFLGDASRVYVHHFYKEIKNAFQRLPDLNGQAISELGPVVIIFQETRDTEPLKQEANQTKESIIRSRFKMLGLTTEAFSAIEYVGIQTMVRPTNFDSLKVCMKRHIKNSSARSPRPISVIYTTLRILNEKFNGDIEKIVPSMFPNQYLTCPTTCLSCNARCTNSMNHHRDNLGHQTETKCIFQHQFNNHILYCRACHERGETVIVNPKTCSSNESPWVGLAKYAWAGYVLECPRCGIIHRSRQYWFGNKDNWESTVRTEIKHVWPGEVNQMQAAQNAAQRVLDSVNYITEAVTTISAKPTKMVSEWVADQIAPNYWIPNSRILYCALCNSEFGQFDQKHHCRLCGNGLCSTCSSKSKPVPERGWGETSVRVCDRCYERSDNLSAISSLPPLPPMLQLQQQPQQEASTNTNGYHNHHHQQQHTDSSNCQNTKNCPKASSSIPIPSIRAASSSVNTTPTPHSSSSIGSSSAGSTNSAYNHLISDLATKSLPNTSPIKQNGLSEIVDRQKSSDAHDYQHQQQSSPKQRPELTENTTNNKKDSITTVSNYSSSSHQSSAPMIHGIQHMNNGTDPPGSTVTARKLGEVLQNTIKTVVYTAIDYPLGVIKDSARPEYWLPDSQILNCGICKKDFGELLTIHHCRRCGGGFCNECSSKSMAVPERGWGDASVRVCDKCYDLK